MLLIISVTGLFACSNDKEKDVEPIETDTITITASFSKLCYVVGYNFDVKKELNYSAKDRLNNKVNCEITSFTYNGNDIATDKFILELTGDYSVTVTATNAEGKEFIKTLGFTVVADETAPDISSEDVITDLPINSSLDLGGLAIVTDNSGNFDYSFTAVRFDGETVQTENNILTLSVGGFYDVTVTAADYSGNSAEKTFRLFTEGVYFNDLKTEDINSWVSNSFISGRPNGIAAREKVQGDNGFSFRFDTVSAEEVSFSIPLNGATLREDEEYYYYIKVRTDAEITGTEEISFFQSGLSSVNGKLTAEVKETVIYGNYTVPASKRLGGPIIQNNTMDNASVYIDYIMLVKAPAFERQIKVNTANCTKEIDENGNFVSEFLKGDASMNFYLKEDETAFAGEKVNVTIEYKLQSDVWVMGNRGAMIVHNLGSEQNLESKTELGDGWLSYTFTTQVVSDERIGYNSAVSGGSVSKTYGTDKPHLSLAFLFNTGAKFTVTNITVTPVKEETVVRVTDRTGYETSSQNIVTELTEHEIDLVTKNAREGADLGLNGNTLYMLPTVTGMSSLSAILTNTDGDVFIIDGGFKDDYQILYHYITALGKTTVKGWFFTHPHEDHINAFAKFTELYADEITVETVYYAFSLEESWYNARYSIVDKDAKTEDINAFKNALETVKAKGTTVAEPVTGDSFTFGSLTFDIIYSPKNVTADNGGVVGDYGLSLDKYGFNEDGTRNSESVRYNVNDLSTVISVRAGDKKLLFFADCGPVVGEYLYGLHQTDGALSADFVQMAHHCQAGVEQNVYGLVQPKYAFFNCNYYMWDNLSGKHKALIVRGWIKDLGATAYCSQLGADGETGESIVYIFR